MTEQQTELLSKLYALTWSAEIEKSIQARRELNALCREHPFLARERARMVKERQRHRVILARRARRGEPLSPVKVIKANGRLRKFGITLPSGRAPRQATNARRRGSCRSAAPTRAGPSDEGDPEPVGPRPRTCWQPAGAS
jgi:hypothetical protein